MCYQSEPTAYQFDRKHRYSAICVTTFGSQLEEYHTFTAAFETLMRALLGDFAYAPLVRVAPIMGPIVFWTFIFVVFFILLKCVRGLSPWRPWFVPYFSAFHARLRGLAA